MTSGYHGQRRVPSGQMVPDRLQLRAPRFDPPTHRHLPGPLLEQEGAKTSGQGLRHLVGHAGQDAAGKSSNPAKVYNFYGKLSLKINKKEP